jgi:hypothetical protein
MTRRSPLWRLAAGLFVVINVLGGVYAIAMGEVRHALLHVVLLVVGAGLWTRYGPARDDGAGSSDEVNAAPPSSELTDRFRNLEQSIDAVAIEVERIGEGQRFMTRLLAERESPPASGRGDPEPAAVDRDRSSS